MQLIQFSTYLLFYCSTFQLFQFSTFLVPDLQIKGEKNRKQGCTKPAIRTYRGQGRAGAFCRVPCILCSEQCAMCSVQCAVCSVQCAVCIVQCAVCSLLCETSVQCAVCNQCAVCSLIELMSLEERKKIVLQMVVKKTVFLGDLELGIF